MTRPKVEDRKAVALGRSALLRNTVSDEVPIAANGRKSNRIHKSTGSAKAVTWRMISQRFFVI